jgi:hypothetical protein
MANVLIPLAQHDQVWDGFENVEHAETGEGVHEKDLTLADKLAREVNHGITDEGPSLYCRLNIKKLFGIMRLLAYVRL